MAESINDWVDRLSAKPLPVMRRTLTRVKDLLNTPSASHIRLSDIVAMDPGFCLSIFQQLNALPKSPREPINKIANAISQLGMVSIERAAITLPALEDRLTGPPRRGLIDCYSRASHAAIYAVKLAERHGQRDPQPFTIAALLHDIGEMALWSQAPEFMRIIQRLEKQGKSRNDAALKVLGFTLDELNQQLGSRWRLPSLVQDSHALFNSYQHNPLTVMMAAALARTSASDWRNQELIDYLELLADFLGVSLDQARAEFHQLAAHAARQLYTLPLPIPARDLILIHLQAETVKPPLTTTVPKPAGKVDTAVSSDRPSPELSPAQVVSPPKKHKSATKSNPLHEQLTHTVKDMQETYNLKSVMFAMLSPDKTRLKARFVMSDTAQNRLNDFAANLNEPSLFAALMKKPQALWLNADNREKYLPMIPDSISQSICGSGFLLMSIFIRNKPIGLFYADNGAKDTGLTTEQYNNFKVSCQRFIQAMT